MNSWEVRALWDESGCGNRTEKPVTRGTGLQRRGRCAGHTLFNI